MAEVLSAPVWEAFPGLTAGARSLSLPRLPMPWPGAWAGFLLARRMDRVGLLQTAARQERN